MPVIFRRACQSVLVLLTLVSVLAPNLSSAQTSEEPIKVTTARRLSGCFRTCCMTCLEWSGDRPRTAFGIKLEQPTSPAMDANGKPLALIVDESRPLVIFVHGWNASAEDEDSLLKPARDLKMDWGAFRYPFNQPIADSAAFLSSELKRVGREQPHRRITLLAFSMGGLVCREALENAKLDPGNVDQLLMVATPSHGTSCARLGHGLEVVKQLVVRSDRYATCADGCYACLQDGMGEALGDMAPESEFLKRLNARPRNPRVNYSIFLGLGGKFSDTQMQVVHLAAHAAKQVRLVKFVATKVEAVVTETNDSLPQSDGIVNVESGRLDGVTDVVLANFDHCSIIDRVEDPATQAVYAGIAKRLQRKPGKKE